MKIIKRSIYHPPIKNLPEHFEFPQDYLDYVNSNHMGIYPWHFLCDSEPKEYDEWVRMVKKHYPERALVPFAIWSLLDGRGDLICFEMSKENFLINVCYLSSKFTDEEFFVKSFEDWMVAVIQDLREYDK